MASRNLVRFVPLLLSLAGGCAGPDPSAETLAEASLAVNACDETVPSERTVDGLPAYSQCSGVSSGNIWSNDGIDTSTSSGGDDWIQTQRGGGYQCTEWAYRYMHFRWGVDYRHGDAKEWCDGELPSTLEKASAPVHGDLIVFDGGACGADETTGHIAVIDVVDTAAAKVTIVEENRAGRRTANQSCGSCFLHAVANDGSAAGAAGSGGADNGGAAGKGGGGMPAGQGGTNAQAGSSALGGRQAGGAAGMATASGGAREVPNGAGGASPLDGAGQGGTSNGIGAAAGTAGSGPVPAAGGAGGHGGAAGVGPATGGGSGQPTLGGAASMAEPPLALDELRTDSASGCAVSPERRGARHGSLALVFAVLLGALRRRRRPIVEACC